MSVPVPEKRNSASSLGNFGRRIEKRFRLGKDQGSSALERQVCRLMASKDLKVAAAMTSKVVEWIFGRPKDQHEHSGEVRMILEVEHFGTADKDKSSAKTG